MKELMLAYDIGTTGAKAVIFRKDASIVGSATNSTTPITRSKDGSSRSQKRGGRPLSNRHENCLRKPLSILIR